MFRYRTYSQNALPPLMIPAFPSDATILSIHLACLRVGLSQNFESSVKDFYGRNVKIDNRFGYGAREFVDRALAGTMRPEELVNQHSLFPFFSNFFTPDLSQRWIDDLARGHVEAFQRYSPATKYGFQPSIGLRQCTACVREDIAKFGMGHWHVMHQIPTIHFCNVHKEVLHDSCADCGLASGFETGWTLPGERCGHCGCRKTKPVASISYSKGYGTFVTLIDRALRGQAPELRPEVKTLLLRQFIAKSNLDSVGLLHHFLSYWNVETLHDLEHIFQCRIPQESALKLFSDGCAQISILVLTAVIAFAWEQTCESDRQKLLMLEQTAWGLLKEDEYENISKEKLFVEIMAIARSYHLPLLGVKYLAQGDRGRATKVMGGMNVFLILDRLCKESRDQFERRVLQYRKDTTRTYTRPRFEGRKVSND